MCDFCLPAGPNSGCAAPKVEQNLQKSEKCSTADSKFGPRGLESRTKSPKIGKIFYSVPSSKRLSCNQCSRSDSKTDKTRQTTIPKLSLLPQTRKAAMTPPINHVPLSAFAPTQVANISQSEVPRASFGTLII